MNFAQLAWDIFTKSVEDYHRHDDVDHTAENPYVSGSLEHLLYAKNGIDTVQWHLEDIIRDENIAPEKALTIKRRIDRLNQQRTDLVEFIDSWFLDKYKNVIATDGARLNTETPAWAADRLSILSLKIFHMKIEAERTDADEGHRAKCAEKLDILLRQKADLTEAITCLLEDIAHGRVMMKVYRQMKMYNDEALNPILYQRKENDRKNFIGS